MAESIEAGTAALLLMDFQQGVTERLPDSAGVLESAARARDIARAAGVRVGYVRVAFRPGHPEIHPRNTNFAAVRARAAMLDGTDHTTLHPVLAPGRDEFVVTKRRVGALVATDLDQILRAGGIQTLVLGGISTSGVVLSTLRHAADLDYRIVVLRDACADFDDEVHRVLLDKVFPRQADVVTVEEYGWLLI